MSYLNLASLRLCTESEGPGKRLALWVQGCNRRCPGCCNAEMQEFKKNIIVESKDLENIIAQAIIDYGIEGITVLGGEPFCQVEGVNEIVKWSKLNGLTVLVFTGYLVEELQGMNSEYVNELLQNVDILVDGPFIEEEYDYNRAWVGSKNQRVLFLSETYKAGIEFDEKARQMEVLVSSEDVLVNGWPYL